MKLREFFKKKKVMAGCIIAGVAIIIGAGFATVTALADSAVTAPSWKSKGKIDIKQSDGGTGEVIVDTDNIKEYVDFKDKWISGASIELKDTTTADGTFTGTYESGEITSDSDISITYKTINNDDINSVTDFAVTSYVQGSGSLTITAVCPSLNTSATGETLTVVADIHIERPSVSE